MDLKESKASDGHSDNKNKCVLTLITVRVCHCGKKFLASWCWKCESCQSKEVQLCLSVTMLAATVPV